MDMTWFTHAEKHTFIKRLYFRAFIPNSVRRSTRVIAISQSTKADIVGLLGIPSDKIVVTYIGVDHKFFRVQRNRTQLEDSLKDFGLNPGYILYVGKLEPRKNLVRLIRAYDQSKNTIGKRKLVLCGSKGWGYTEIYSIVERLGLRDQVIFTGYVPDKSLPIIYNGADVFVYPSLYEGFGIPVLEAMACGVPAITSNLSSLPEVVGNAGVLVDPYSTDAIGEALIDLLRHDDRRSELSELGLYRAKEFTWERMARETLRVYQQCLTPQYKSI
jgi:glycosyltransferase involved in cell wall biosynthesis